MDTRITSEAADRIAVITMDDGKANVLSPAMQAELNAHLDVYEDDDNVRVIVLAGRDGVFSGGFDLEVMASGDMAAIVEMVASGGELVRRLYGLPKPVVAAVTGSAVAAGSLLLLGCDVRVGIETPAGVEGASKIGLNEVAIGMAVPEWAITIAGQRLSNRHLNRSLLNARLTDGPTAVDVGFLDMVVSADAVRETAVDEAHNLVDLDPASYAEMIRRYREAVLEEMTSKIAIDRGSR